MSDFTLITVSIAKHFDEKVLYERNSAGALSLVSSLEQAGYTVTFSEYSLDFRCAFAEEVERFIPLIDQDAAVIGIGCHSVHLPFVVKISQKIKEIFPQKKIVLGGIGPSGVAKELVSAFGWIDAVVVGEGEETIVEVMEKEKDGFAGIPGVVYRESSQVKANAARMPKHDLDALPLPAYHLVDFAQYEIPTIIASRGCSHGCPFCSLSSFWGKKICYRSIDSIMQEVRYLHDVYNVRYIFFGDPTFITGKERLLTLCRRFEEEQLDIHWECLVRLDCIDEEMMKAMQKSGCEAIFYGLESGSEQVHSRIKKGFSVKESLEVIALSVNYFKAVEVGLMWGFPFESLGDFKETVRIRNYLVNDLGCQVQLRWLEPYPKTALFEQYKDMLFFPEEESIVSDKQSVSHFLEKEKVFYQKDEKLSGIQISTDVTSVRFVIAAAHVLSLCRDLIREYPNIFCDFYRYKTPHLSEKLRLAQACSMY